MPTEFLILAAAIYATMSVITFIAFWLDKRAAQRAKQRTPEKMLLSLALCGGWPGALLAMKLCRHKTRKWLFKLGIPTIAGLHIALWLTIAISVYHQKS